MLSEDYFSRDRFSRDYGVRIIESGDGFAKAAFDIDDRHRNAHGTVHGGMIFTLADVAFCYACMSKGGMSVSLQANVHFTAPAINGRLTATAREVSRTKRTGVYEVTVTDDANAVIAIMTGTAYIKEI